MVLRTVGAVILDLGCGTGVVARALAAASGFSGRVIGIEQSPVFVEVARRLAADEGVGERVEFRVGDVHAFDIADASMDAVIAHTTISHVTDPLGVLKEAKRVLRPGGVFAAFGGDYASWTFSYSDHAIAKAMEEATLAAVVSKPRVMRDMPRLLRDAGLQLVDVNAHVCADRALDVLPRCRRVIRAGHRPLRVHAVRASRCLARRASPGIGRRRVLRRL